MTFEAWVYRGRDAGRLINRLMRLRIFAFAVHVNETKPPLGGWKPIDVTGGVIDV